MLPHSVAAVATLLALPTLPAAAQERHSGYGEGQSTQVKTLTQAQVDELLAGAGMGMALPAALNGFPGPRHLVERLEKSETLRAELRRVHLAAHLETRPLLTLHQIQTYDRLRGYGGRHVH